MRLWSWSRDVVMVAASLVWLVTPLAAAAASPAPPLPTVDPAAITPNVRVTDIRPMFVPSVPDVDGDGCSGPYLDLRFTIANLGATFPVSDELAQTQSIPMPAEGYTLLALMTWIDQAGTGEAMAQANVPMLMADVPGQVLVPGQSVEVIWRYRVPSDQGSMRFFGENGTPRAISQVTFENVGGSDTPGPVTVNVSLRYPDVSFIGGWTGVSRDPVPAQGTVPVIGETGLVGDRPLERGRLLLDAYAQALGPDGSAGGLSDRNSTDNGRELRQAGQKIVAGGDRRAR